MHASPVSLRPEAGTSLRATVSLRTPPAAAADGPRRAQAHRDDAHAASRADRAPRTGWSRTAHDGGAARADLRLRIEQTFRDLAVPRSEGGEGRDAADEASFSATLKARLRVGDDGGVQAQLKLRLEVEGDAGAASFAAALDRFTQALAGALEALFGRPASADPAIAAPTATVLPGSTPTAPAGASAASTPDASAAPAVTASTAASGSTPGAASLSASTGSPASTPTDGPAAPSSAPAAAAGAPAPSTPTGTLSVSIKLRLSYGAIGGSEHGMPGLIQRLAEPGAASQVPALATTLGDLREALDRLWSWAPAGSGPAPSLGRFLTALAQSYRPADGAWSTPPALPTLPVLPRTGVEPRVAPIALDA